MSIIAKYKFDKSVYDNLIPTFNDGYTGYTVNDITEGNVVTRTIECNTLPTLMTFGKRGMESDSSMSLLEVNYLNTSNITDMSYMFSYCRSLTLVNTDNWDTSNVEAIASMFYFCESLTQLNVNNFNIDKVADISRIFAYCLKLTSLDLSNWNTSNATNMNRTFAYCSQMTELNLSGWNVDKVADTTMTFAYCNKLDTIKIYNCKANMISTLNWSSVFPTEVISGKTRTIYCDEALVGQIEPPTNWVLSSEKNYDIKVVEYKFNNTLYNLIPEFNAEFINYTYEDIVEGNTTTRTIYSDSLPTLIRFGINSDGEFGNNKSNSLLEVLSLNADNLNTYQRMFKLCEYVKSINCENVTINNAHEMFAFCCSLNTLNVNSYDMSNATNINNMFYYCNTLTSLDISNWNLNDSVDTSNLFNSCFSLNNITMNNSDHNSVNKIIAQLPTRTANSMGVLTIAEVDDINQVNTTTAESKFWNIEAPILIARYTANASGVLPTFNTGYQYTVNETESNGVYTVELYSDTDFTSCSFYGKSNLLTVEYLRVTNNVTTMINMFYGCTNLTSLNVSNFNTSNVTSMKGMFKNCYVLENLDVSNWNTSKVTTMESMFSYCESLTTLDVSNWNTNKVTIMDGIFSYCKNLQYIDVSGWDTSNVTSMGTFFRGCTSLTSVDISNFDTSKATQIYYMFNKCQSLTEINVSNLNFNSASNISYMFWGCSNLTKLDLSNWDLSTIGRMDVLIRDCTNLTELNLSNWDISHIDASCMMNLLYNCTSLNLVKMNNSNYESINKIIELLPTNTNPGVMYVVGVDDISQVNIATAESKNWTIDDGLNMIAQYTFTSTTDTLPIFNDGFEYIYNDIDNGDGTTTRTIKSYTLPTSMSFENCAELISVNYLKTDELTSMANMFKKCSKLASINAEGWNISKVTSINSLFYSCSSLTSVDLSSWDTSNVTDMGNLFRAPWRIKTINLTGWNTSKVTDMNRMFYNMQQLISIEGLDGFDTSNVENMSYMFYSCLKIPSIDTSSFDTSSVTDISNMFEQCKALTSLDVSNFDTSNVTNSKSVFAVMESLTTLNISNWDFGAITNTNTSMFNYTKALTTVKMENCSVVTINKVIDGLPAKTADNPGLLIVSDLDPAIDTATAESKFWKISILIAKYTANVSGVLPIFNEGYQYTINETVNDGIYTVELYAEEDFSSCSFANKTELLTVDFLKVTDNVTTFSKDNYGMFDSCNKLTYINTENWDTSNVTNTNYMFYGCSSLTQIDINNWDVSNLTSTVYMFYNCNSLLSLDLSNWNTVKLISINGMFYYCNSIIDLNLSNWETSSLTNISSMVYSCTNLVSLNISNFDLNKVSSLGFVFEGCSSLNYVIMNDSDYSSVNKIITELPTRTSNSPGTLLISVFDPSINKSSANSKYWNIYATIVEYTFNSSVDTLPIFNSGYTYTYTDIDNGDGTITRTIKSDTSPTSMSFNNKTELVSLNYLNTSNVTDTSYMFYNCSKLTSIDLSNFNTSNVTNMGYMFYGCSKLTSLDLSNFNTSKVTSMIYMFSDCNALTSIDLSNFDTSKVTDMNNMFSNCSNLVSVDMNNSDYNSVNKIISVLPTRTIDSPGALSVPISTSASNIDLDTARSKFWNIIITNASIKNIFLGYQKINNLGNGFKNVYLGSKKLI